MSDLGGKVAIVLGAGGEGNIGQAIVRALHGAGATVIASARSPVSIEGATSALCDITDKRQVDALFDDTVAAHGKVDIAINATGWGLLKPLLEVTEDELEAMVALQFKGVHHFLAAAIRTMTGMGSVVQISSATVEAPIPDHAAYIGTKAGAEALVRCVAYQYGGQGLRVNTVSPGLTASPMTAQVIGTPGFVDAFTREYPLGRIGTPEDIAEAVLWLASDACFMTGQTLQVNGGLTLRRNPTADEIGAAIAKAMAG